MATELGMEVIYDEGNSLIISDDPLIPGLREFT